MIPIMIGLKLTGEKDYEEFYTDGETLDLNRFADIGIVKKMLILTMTDWSILLQRSQHSKRPAIGQEKTL